MGKREELEKERDELSRELFVRLYSKSIEIDKKIQELVIKKPGDDSNEMLGVLIYTEEFIKEYSRLMREKEQIDSKIKEIWKRILEINQKLKSIKI